MIYFLFWKLFDKIIITAHAYSSFDLKRYPVFIRIIFEYEDSQSIISIELSK